MYDIFKWQICKIYLSNVLEIVIIFIVSAVY